MESGFLISQSNSEIEPEGIAQSCLNCVFATTYNKKQEGCKLGRLERFQKNGSKLLTVTKKYELAGTIPDKFHADPIPLKHANEYVLCTYYGDEMVDVEWVFLEQPDVLNEKSYTIIDEKYCNTYRNQYSDWVKFHKNKDLLTEVRSEITTKFTVTIHITDKHTIQDLENTLNSLTSQTLKPFEVILLNDMKKIKPFELSNILKILESYNILWRNNINYIGDNTKLNDSFDSALQYIKGRFVIIMEAGKVLSNNILEELDISLNDRLEKWLCVIGNDYLVVQSKICKYLNGFREVKFVNSDKYVEGVIEKIKWFANQQNKQYMIKTFEEISRTYEVV